MKSLFDLTGKSAIVTGSTRGIGRAIALGLAQAGARVTISSRKAEACATVAAEFRAAGHEALAVPCNVAGKAELETLVSQTLGAFGGVDVLVCNAGINPYYGPMGGMPDEAFDKVINTNLRSTFWLCNKVAPLIAERGGGAIILVTSIAGLRGNAVIGAYGISKAAEAQLARNLAVEWGPKNIRVNALAPGLIKTGFSRALWEDPERRAHVEQRTPLRRIGEVEDIGGVAVFLASRAGAYVTGQTILVDGGDSIV